MNMRLSTKARSISSIVSYRVLAPYFSLAKSCVFLLSEYLTICLTAYHTLIHFRLRQALRVVVAVPVGVIIFYMSYASVMWYPEPLISLDMSTVVDCKPLFLTTNELLDFACACSHRYRQLCAEGRVLTSVDSNELIGDMLTILRSITTIGGSFEERNLITSSTFTDPSRGVEQGASPAEAVLRVVLYISQDQGWFDILEEARKMFELFVRDHPVPSQAKITGAVADLCTLSYELEHCRGSGDVSLSQRQRVARAIDAFRPEKAVRERCTIAAEIDVLPLVDLDKTTRCLMLTRHSPGRRPQLIITFIGTNSARTWWTNFRYTMTELPKAFGMRAFVHKGFLELLKSIPFEEVVDEFDQIIVIGHSMGGALAQLAGLYLANERAERRVTILSVASPRVFASCNGYMRDTIWRLLGFGAREGEKSEDDDIRLPSNCQHIRTFMCTDVVPKLPPSFLGYKHVGTPLPLYTGCPTRTSFLGWGLWSVLFHTADMYKAVLERPAVAQLHHYENPSAHHFSDGHA